MKELVDAVSLPKFEAMLETLERRVLGAEKPTYKARTLSLAGDLCFEALQPERGLSYYDRAITIYIDSGQYELAGRICEKIVALWPQAVRTYWTLAWLAVRRGVPNAARVRIGQYVVAAENHGLERVACTHLVMLSEAGPPVEVLESIAEALLILEDNQAADRIYGRMHDAQSH